MFYQKRRFKYTAVVRVIWQGASGVSLHGDDAGESSSEPAAGYPIPPEACLSDISSESSAPPMFQPLPSGKLMNVRDEISNISELSDDISDTTTCPPVKKRPDETYSEYIEKLGLDEIASISTSIASHQTGKTLYERDKLMSEDLQQASYEGDSLLVAVEVADEQAVQRLLGLPDSDVNMTDENGKTALQLACEQGFDIIVEKILDHADTDVNQKENNKKDKQEGQSALKLACSQAHLGVVDLLVRHPKINVDEVNNCLNWFSGFGPLQVVHHLLQHPDVDVNNGSYMTPLKAACQAGILEIVEKLLERNEIDVNKAPNKGTTPLFIACGKAHIEIVQKLLERKEIDVNKAYSYQGFTPLYIACENGHLQIVEKLLAHRTVEVNQAVTTDGTTPLLKACEQGHIEVVQKLLERNDIEINKAYTRHYLPKIEKTETESEINRIEKGSTPLMITAYFGQEQIVEQILSHPNVAVDQMDDVGNTAMKIAEREGHEDIVNLLREAASHK